MLRKILENLVYVFQMFFGYVFTCAILGISIEVISLNNINPSILILFIFVLPVLDVRPQFGSLYPFEFQMKLRFQQDFGSL